MDSKFTFYTQMLVTAAAEGEGFWFADVYFLYLEQ